MSKQRKLSYLFSILWVAILFAAIMGAVATGVINSYYSGILVLIGINIILAVSLNLVTGFFGAACAWPCGLYERRRLFRCIVHHACRPSYFRCLSTRPDFWRLGGCHLRGDYRRSGTPPARRLPGDHYAWLRRITVLLVLACGFYRRRCRFDGNSYIEEIYADYLIPFL